MRRRAARVAPDGLGERRATCLGEPVEEAACAGIGRRRRASASLANDEMAPLARQSGGDRGVDDVGSGELVQGRLDCGP